MKVYKKEEEKPKFVPVIIELSSLAEVNAMRAIVGNVSGGGPARLFYDDIYGALENYLDRHGYDEIDLAFYDTATLHANAKSILGFDDQEA